jgi:hypothetical protein
MRDMRDRRAYFRDYYQKNRDAIRKRQNERNRALAAMGLRRTQKPRSKAYLFVRKVARIYGVSHPEARCIMSTWGSQ